MVALPLQLRATCCPAYSTRTRRTPRAQIKGFGSKSMAIFPFAIAAAPALAEEDIAGAVTQLANPAPSIDYDSVINQSVSALQSSAGGIDQEGLFSIVSENPALIIGGALALVTLPAIPALLSGGSKGYGGNVTPRQAVEMMEAATKAVLVDVRSKAVVKAEGVPALKGTGATRLGVPIKISTPDGEEVINDSFVDSVVNSRTLKKAMDDESEKIVLIVSDSAGSVAAQGAAMKLAEAGFGKNVFALKGGLTGPGGWKDSDLPWKEPFELSLPSLSVPELNKETATIALGAAAAVGASALVFTEFETLLELVGSVAAIQIFINKFLFADDREKTVKTVQKWLDTKVMPNELAADVKNIISSTVEDTGLVESGEKKREQESETPSATPEVSGESSDTEKIVANGSSQVNVNVQ